MSTTLDRTHTALAGIEFDPEVLPALADLRSRALSHHLAAGIPTTKDEEWKYTSLRELGELYFLQGGARPLAGADVDALALGDMPQVRVVFVNGLFNGELSSPLDGVDGLQIRLLSQDSSADGLGALVKTENFPFAALNTATFRDGIAIRITKNAKIDLPIHVVFLAAADPNNAVSYSAPRLVVHAETGSQAELIETYASVGGTSTMSNAVAEVFVAENASLEHIKIQRESTESYHFSTTEVRQERDSSFNHYSVTLGGKLTRNDLNVFLNGSNLHSRMDGIVVIDGAQHADNHTRLDHAFPHCDSFEVYKHVLDGQSTAVFNGKIYVHQDAQKTDAKQTNNTLLLSPQATINSKPQLEIFADDVKCTHGATVGQLDTDPMFYLRSRGIPETQARAMLVYAFAAEVLEKISNRDLVARLEALLDEKLGNL